MLEVFSIHIYSGELKYQEPMSTAIGDRVVKGGICDSIFWLPWEHLNPLDLAQISPLIFRHSYYSVDPDSS